MKAAKLKFVSPLQTEHHPLRHLLVKCVPYGLTVERDPQRGTYYKICAKDQDLTRFTTLSKLTLWMEGFEKGTEYIINENQEQDENDQLQ